MDQKRSIETRLKGVGILRRTTRYLLVTMLAVLASATALQAQNTVIKGVVTDKGGAPIAGVTVVAKVWRAMWIVGLNDRPACLATCRNDMFSVLWVPLSGKTLSPARCMSL